MAFSPTIAYQSPSGGQSLVNVPTAFGGNVSGATSQLGNYANLLAPLSNGSATVNNILAGLAPNTGSQALNTNQILSNLTGLGVDTGGLTNIPQAVYNYSTETPQQVAAGNNAPTSLGQLLSLIGSGNTGLTNNLTNLLANTNSGTTSAVTDPFNSLFNTEMAPIEALYPYLQGAISAGMGEGGGVPGSTSIGGVGGTGGVTLPGGSSALNDSVAAAALPYVSQISNSAMTQVLAGLNSQVNNNNAFNLNTALSGNNMTNQAAFNTVAGEQATQEAEQAAAQNASVGYQDANNLAKTYAALQTVPSLLNYAEMIPSLTANAIYAQQQPINTSTSGQSGTNYNGTAPQFGQGGSTGQGGGGGGTPTTNPPAENVPATAPPGVDPSLADFMTSLTTGASGIFPGGGTSMLGQYTTGGTPFIPQSQNLGGQIPNYGGAYTNTGAAPNFNLTPPTTNSSGYGDPNAAYN